jgi:hypothetical protein
VVNVRNDRKISDVVHQGKHLSILIYKGEKQKKGRVRL